MTDKDTVRKTYHMERRVVNAIEESSDDWDWTYTKIVNRAVMYYIWKARKGELDDPKGPYNSEMEDAMDRMKSKEWNRKDSLIDRLRDSK